MLIDKYEVLSGALKGRRLNAADSMRCGELQYDACAETDALTDALTDAEAAPIHGVLNKDAWKKNPRAAKPAAPADPRFQPSLSYAYESFRSKHGQPPTWNERQFQTLKALLGRRKDLTPAEFERRWNHYSASTEPFTVKQGNSLSHFCNNFDAFISGPILAATAKVGTNGAEQRNDNIRGIAESLDGFAKTRAN